MTTYATVSDLPTCRVTSKETYPPLAGKVQTLATFFSVLFFLGPTPLLAQEPAPTPVGPKVGVHIGIFDPSTPSGRTISADLARLCIESAKARPGLAVTSDPPDTWLTDDHFRHEGALLACMDPFLTKKQVIACIAGLPFPVMPEGPPKTARFQISGTVRTSEPGLVATLMLQPVVDGWPGPSVVTREVLISRRLRRPAREKALADALAPLLDMAEGKVVTDAPAPAVAPRKRRHAKTGKRADE
jgi:hypothetical protein